MSIQNKPKNRKKSVAKKPKVLVILGPTSSGKTDLGVKLAAAYNGEIISADSRQVYRGLDIGSGKDLSAYRQGKQKIKYHLIDVIDPSETFDLAAYQSLANQAIKDILRRKKLPILVGGSGLYLQALVDNYHLNKIPGNNNLRRKLEKLSAVQLFDKLVALNSEFARRLNNSDRHNPRRLIRYLEVIQNRGEINRRQESPYNFLVVGIDCSDAALRERIVYRLLVMLEQEGLIAEVHRLHQEGLSWERLLSFGLEYRFVVRHLLGELSYTELVDKLGTAVYRFAKRQKTWFKRWEKQGRKIFWIKKPEQIEKILIRNL